MRHFLLLTVSVFLLAASACSTVTVTEPIGEGPVSIQPEQWEGLWKLYFYTFDEKNEEMGEEEGFLLIEVPDSENGVLEVQGISRESKPFLVYLRESNGWMFGSIKNPEEADDKGMSWGRIKKDEDRIIFWVPDYDRFSDFVKDELLPGHTEDGESDGMFDDKFLILSELKPEHMDLITSESKGILFHWDEPFFMVRVSNDID